MGSRRAPGLKQARSLAGPWLSAPAAALFLLGLVFYAFTLSPGVNWGDGARLQMDVMLGGSTYMYLDEVAGVPTDGWPFDRLGVAAWDHPLYVMLGQIFRELPWGDPTWRINLMSAVAAAVTLVLLYRLAFDLTADRWAAALGVLALAVSHTFWLMAVTAEVYTLHAVFMTSLIWLAVRSISERRLKGWGVFAFLAGLGLANHIMLVLTILPATAFVAWLLATGRGHTPTADDAPVGDEPMAIVTGSASSPPIRKPLSPKGGKGSRAVAEPIHGRPRQPGNWRRMALLAAALFIVGLAPWWIQFLRMARLIGVGLTLRIASGYPGLTGRLSPVLPAVYARDLADYLVMLQYQFTPIGFLLGLAGIVRLWRLRRREAQLLVLLFLVHVAFSATYRVPDRFTFHLPSYLLFSLFIAAGVAGVLAVARRFARPAAFLLPAVLLAATISPVALYRATPALIRGAGLWAVDLGIPDVGSGARDGLRYFLDPNKRGDTSAQRFGRSTLADLAAEACVLTPWPVDQEAYVVLRYFQKVEGRRPDVTLDLLLFETGDSPRERVLARVQAVGACRPLYLASLDAEAYPRAELAADFEIAPQANLYRLVPRRLAAAPADCARQKRRRETVPLEELVRMALQ